MTVKNTIDADDLLDLFSSPITTISQVMRQSNIGSCENFSNAWGGHTPVLVVSFENERNSVLCISADTDRLILRLIDNCENIVASLLDYSNQLQTENCDKEEDVVIGLFDLDSVLSPVSGWDKILVSQACIVSNKQDESVLGFCLWINLGVRIGVFTPPHPGATLSFNDSCDQILVQARDAEQRGAIYIKTREYPDMATPKQVDTVDWFDWM